ILINLCENGLRYSFRKHGQASLTLRVQLSESPPMIILDVIDNGEGIPTEVAKHIFEPFFSTENNGSGLGLYIAKELSQMNGTRLDYVATHHQDGSQFRLTFPKAEVNT
ncbi:MAG TPA: ATP-binding protein, partial [Candidatus Berkiella sp.]|nr:ATP-binding protein [Candidatus Berkiella sp.]